MKIKETIERECCQSKDLRPLIGSRSIGLIKYSEYKFCMHCARHKYHSFMDAAGSTDWEYRKVHEDYK